jgi:hypothetical protein
MKPYDRPASATSHTVARIVADGAADPGVRRWLARSQARTSWQKVDEASERCAASLKRQPMVAV